MPEWDLTGEDRAHLELCRDLERAYLTRTDPYGGSGSSSNPVGWFQGRHSIVEAMHRDGAFLDVGCAAGHLAASLVPWGAARGLNLEPHGLDLSTALVERARARLPEYAANFHVGNAWFWRAPRRYDFVVVLLDVCPPGRMTAFLQRLHRDFLTRGGRLVCSLYLCAPGGGPGVDGREEPRRIVQSSGLTVDGEIVGPTKSRPRGTYCTRTVWVERRTPVAEAGEPPG